MENHNIKFVYISDTVKIDKKKVSISQNQYNTNLRHLMKSHKNMIFNFQMNNLCLIYHNNYQQTFHKLYSNTKFFL